MNKVYNFKPEQIKWIVCELISWREAIANNKDLVSKGIVIRIDRILSGKDVSYFPIKKEELF